MYDLSRNFPCDCLATIWYVTMARYSEPHHDPYIEPYVDLPYQWTGVRVSCVRCPQKWVVWPEKWIAGRPTR